MAKVKYNVVTHGVSGRVGDLLEFRQRHGKTIISKIAARSKNVTPGQQLVRDRFRKAAAWAKSALKNPLIKEIYEMRAAGDISSFNLALKDFCTSPVITTVSTGDYNGGIGHPIMVTATDDTKVAEVVVRIIDSNSALVEEGAAVQQEDEATWIYTTTTVNSTPSGGSILVEARDMPGNTSGYEAVLQ